ncbi:uracil-DNA glycosylase [Zhongshania sp. BJYM1]|jgi:uracil-DNA glycosylase|uniref:uracil-DNA glycosylase n=1 Tax=Zhongshania aquatica TaxID=2965069 RepID=UPI0022B4718C|nr:uracil-DNA glycosylase [Marortus sp. BJYM1]
MTIDLDASWHAALGQQFQLEYFQNLIKFIDRRLAEGVRVFPPRDEWFAALNSTPTENVKAVIIGQDPYHGFGQAHGLSFSVPRATRIPPSLRNIYKELRSDLGIDIPQHGCLQAWAERGVLLLNSVLTVEEGAAGSHQGKGWELFTDAIIEHLNNEREGVVFLLWGSHAQKKGAVINRQRHLVLEAPHPSPLSAHRGFLGCGHFSKANVYLEARGETPVNWRL